MNDNDDGLDGYETIAADPLEDAGDDADTKIVPFIDPDLGLCPVVPLGFLAGKVVFAMPEGEIRQEPARQVGPMLRADIFACAAGQAFLANWRDKEGKFQREQAAVWFVRNCRKAGLWDSSRPLRELGVWPGDEAADLGPHLVLHLGDRIWRVPQKGKAEDLSIFEALRVRRGPLYRLRPPAPRPKKACGSVDGQWVRDWLDRWAFEPIGREGLTGADVVAGWLMASLLGGFAPFRGHLLVHALQGSGKTELMLFVQALLSGLGVEVIDSFSEAGLKNELAGNARPVLIDEAESGADPRGAAGVVEKALELLRRMATGDGGRRKQGDVGGGTVTQTAVGAAMVAGIAPPRLGPADASRFVEIRLLPLRGRATTRADLDAAKSKARALAPALLGRALKGAWRYRADLDAVTAALSQSGETPRSADLLAMMIAGRRLLLFDAPLTEDEAAAEVAFWRPLIAAREATAAVTNAGAQALAHLMSADARIHVRDRPETVGGLLQRWSRMERDYDDVLKAIGLKILEDAAPDGRPGPWLLVANDHPRLESVFRGTHWQDWRRVLGHLDALGEDHATWSPRHPVRFGVGVKVRALAIPLAPWLEIAAPSMAPGVVPLRPMAAVPPNVPPVVPEEDLEWPD
ncbi:hypothetical protein [Phenylobacterium sp.]|uniref:hypothetical protein n=1 Tax=Phenylobacterium sp. TaxID=1871053 RepID=UPI00301D0D8D